MHLLLRPVFLALLLTGCATPAYKWGAAEDPEWSGRTGTARFADVVSVLGAPRQQMTLPNGEMKVRWIGEPVTVNSSTGSIEDHSLRRTEQRMLWRDMIFTSDGVLVRAWTSDQRDLADSEAP